MIQIAYTRILIVLILIVPAIITKVFADDSRYIRHGVVLPAGSAEEGLVFVPETGNYILTYKTQTVDGNDVLFQIEYVPATKIDPEIKSMFRHAGSYGVQYSYRISNAKEAEQYIDSIMLMAGNIIAHSEQGPDGWRSGSYILTNNRGSDISKKQYIGTNVAWSAIKNRGNGIAPGKTVAGYKFDSNYLPGIGTMRLDGAVGKVLGFSGEGPQGDVGRQFNALYENDYVKRFVAAPRIEVPTPFDAAVALANLKQHIQVDLINLDQISPVFALQLGRFFETAITAVKKHNLDAARNDIKAIRKLIHEEHEELENEESENHSMNNNGLITMLAAKVLMFDLKYIYNQLEAAKDTSY